jgi:hypothetical protein
MHKVNTWLPHILLTVQRGLHVTKPAAVAAETTAGGADCQCIGSEAWLPHRETAPFTALGNGQQSTCAPFHSTPSKQRGIRLPQLATQAPWHAAAC